MTERRTIRPRPYAAPRSPRPLTVGRRRNPWTRRTWMAAGLVAALPVMAWTIASFRDASPSDVVLTGLAAQAAGIRREVVGESVEGRDIEAYTIGDGPVRVAILGGMHTGLEDESSTVVRDMLEHYAERPGSIPNGVQLIFVPLLNPDGKEAGSRTNANGVDLNRNWPSSDWSPVAVHSGEAVYAGDGPLSEPETAAAFDYLFDLQPAIVLSYHGYAGVVDDNAAGGALRLAGTFAQAAGYEHVDEWVHYEVSGQFIDAMGELGIAAADVELEDGDGDALERNLRGLDALLGILAPKS